MIQKIYGGFTICLCLLFTVLAFALIVYPISGNIIVPPYNDEKYALYQVILTVIAFLAFIPQPVALSGYYFSGAIGKNWVSHALFAGLVLTLLLLILTVLYALFSYMTTETVKMGDSMFQRFTAPRILFGTLNFTIFPIIFTIAALMVKKVPLWVRFLPMISFVLVLIITAILAILIYAIGSITRSPSIYSGAMDATLTQWFMLGSAAWSLIGLSLFLKSTKKETEPVSN